jgi:hypothetical protein
MSSWVFRFDNTDRRLYTGVTLEVASVLGCDHLRSNRNENAAIGNWTVADGIFALYSPIKICYALPRSTPLQEGLCQSLKCYCRNSIKK